MIALSTSWRSKQCATGRELIALFRGLGFEAIEIEYRLNQVQLADVMRAVDVGDIRVVSVHNYVPFIRGEGTGPDGGDRFLLSALDEDERRVAVAKTTRSLRIAKDVGAEAVVLHLGTVPLKTAPGCLIDIVRKGSGDSAEADRLRRALKKERQLAGEAYAGQVLKSILDLQPVAADLDLRLGLENRYYYSQIPSPEELELFLSETDPGVVGYWHDVGHAEVNSLIGLRNHTDHLEKARGRLIGMHIHDMIGPDDHIAPGTGEFDFDTILPWWTPELLTVMELHSRVTEDDVVRGREFLEAKGLGRTGAWSA
ncbi:MAG: sugar phosphate isomerase/epimerase [Candidatus Eisenbacteria sp.]|nr:sugar phosphate isomerase/epimerase [Candidatus Eisenbacteria bacterium]